jgi:hypothetical protein
MGKKSNHDLPDNYKKLDGSERSPRYGAKLVGPADGNETLSVTIRVRRKAGAPILPDIDHWIKTPPGKRQYISREDFAASYGASKEDLDKVSSFATANHLTVKEVSDARRVVEVSGTVDQMNKAFAVKLGMYKTANETYRGREGGIHLPQDLTGIIEGVFGLDNRRMARRHIPITATAPEPQKITLPQAGSLDPVKVAGLYNFPPMPNAFTQTIGLLEFSDSNAGLCGYRPSDITAYFTTNKGIGPGYTTPALKDVLIDGSTNSPGGGGDSEVALDIQVAGAVAQGAKIAVYFAPFTEKGWVDAITTIVHDTANAPSVLSISWAWTEFEAFGSVLAWTQQAMQAVSTTFQEAAFMGMTVFVASGDNGSNCQIGDGKAHVYYPSSDPWITSCGGTSINNVSGSSFQEVTWNDNGITGGGISDCFNLPIWQSEANIPASVNTNKRVGRGIPDIAGYANGYTIVLNGASSPGWWGTSETAPLYAGLTAVINGYMGRQVGYLNPTFYELAKAPGQTVFRDINDNGSNAVSPAPGYKAGAGWDACTGLGSINGHALLAELLRSDATLQQRTGDFDGDGIDEILVSSPWGVGILKQTGTTMNAIMMSPNGTRFGGWLLETADNQFGPIADYDGDGHVEILVSSAWGIGILKLSGGTLTAPMMQPNGTRFGGWLLNTGDNKFGPAADFDGDGHAELLISSPWGLGILKMAGNTMSAPMMQPNGTRFGGWLLNTADNNFGPASDFDGDGHAELFISSPWGVGILKMAGNTMSAPMMQPNGTRFGGWLLNTAGDNFGPAADFDGDGRAELFILSPWGVGILKMAGTTMSAPMMQPNGTRFGGWLLATADDEFGPTADYDADGKAEILVTSAWGIGILKMAGTTMSAPMMQPNGTRFGGWLLNTVDNRFGTPGKFSGGTQADIFVKSPWGIGILKMSGNTMAAPMMQPNGTRFGGWLLNTVDNVF